MKRPNVNAVVNMHRVEDNIIQPAGELAAALALVGLALVGYSQAVAHMPIKWRREN